MIAPEKLPDMIRSWIDSGKVPADIQLHIRWFDGSLGAGISLFLRGGL